MNKLNKIKLLAINIVNNHKENKIFYFRILVHVFLYFSSSNFRKKYCLIDPHSDFFYSYRKLIKYFSIPLLILGRYFEKKKIFISVNNNNNSSVGHIFPEIDQLKRMQTLDPKYIDSHILFVTSKKEILSSTFKIFNSKKFTVLIGGIKHLILTLVAIRYPVVSIDASLGQENYVYGDKQHPPIVTFHEKSKVRAAIIRQTQNFYPIKNLLKNYERKKNKLFEKLNISRKYIVVQMKVTPTNATFKPAIPDQYLDTIRYFQKKNYDVVFAGRENFPKIFYDNNVINYATSKHASPLNDCLIIGGCNLVISSASGFCNIAEAMDKPLLVFNTFHGIQQFGRRTILLPTLLSRNNEKFNATIQHKYLCEYGQKFGRPWFSKPENLYLLHMASSKEILEASKELEKMEFEEIPPFTQLQKKIRDMDGCPLLSVGLSRISEYYLANHESFFLKS